MKTKQITLSSDQIIKLFLTHSMEHLDSLYVEGGEGLEFEKEELIPAVRNDAVEFCQLIDNKISPEILIDAFFGEKIK